MSLDRKPKGVFTIIEADNVERPIFRRIGTAFVNQDHSLNVLLDASPISGKLHIRELPQKPQHFSTGERDDVSGVDAFRHFSRISSSAD